VTVMSVQKQVDRSKQKGNNFMDWRFENRNTMAGYVCRVNTSRYSLFHIFIGKTHDVLFSI
jgi:hypothetical protein